MRRIHLDLHMIFYMCVDAEFLLDQVEFNSFIHGLIDPTMLRLATVHHGWNYGSILYCRAAYAFVF